MGVVSSQGNVPGRPVVDAGTCSACGLCAETCPTGVLRLDGRGIRVDHGSSFDCIACGQCMMVCPSGSVSVDGRNLSPGDLVELPPREQRATAGQLEALFLSRRSIRRFRSAEVPREVLDRVVAAASTAPMGVPPWEVGVTVFHGREKVAELARDGADGYAGLLRYMDNAVAMGLLRLFAKRATYEQIRTFILPLARTVADGRKAGQDHLLYGAPAALLFHASPYADGSDAFIACTYAMLAAQSLGLGTCMIGCLAPLLARRKDLLRKYGLPAGNKPKIALILGYPENEYRRGIRRSFQSVAAY